MQQDAEDAKFMRSTFDLGNPRDGSDWVDAFVKEMVNAIDRDDAKGRTARFLEAFERNIVAYSRASEEVNTSFVSIHFSYDVLLHFLANGIQYM